MPWQKGGVCWGSVIRLQLDGKFKFFYSTDFPGIQESAVLSPNSQQGRNHYVVCYGESDDGLVWRRPALNRYFKEQFPGNNIMLTWASYYNDSPSVIEDLHERDPRRRYKLMLFPLDTRNRDLSSGCLFVSPDGRQWTFTGTVLPSQDASALWQDRHTGRYHAFLKDRQGENRSRLVVPSDDFKTWSEPQWIFTPDHGDHAGTNFYNQSAFMLGGRTLGFLNLYDLTTQTTWVELIESGDNLNWRRMPSRPHLLGRRRTGNLRQRRRLRRAGRADSRRRRLPLLLLRLRQPARRGGHRRQSRAAPRAGVRHVSEKLPRRPADGVRRRVCHPALRLSRRPAFSQLRLHRRGYRGDQAPRLRRRV